MEPETGLFQVMANLLHWMHNPGDPLVDGLEEDLEEPPAPEESAQAPRAPAPAQAPPAQDGPSQEPHAFTPAQERPTREGLSRELHDPVPVRAPEPVLSIIVVVGVVTCVILILWKLTFIKSVPDEGEAVFRFRSTSGDWEIVYGKQMICRELLKKYNVSEGGVETNPEMHVPEDAHVLCWETTHTDRLTTSGNVPVPGPRFSCQVDTHYFYEDDHKWHMYKTARPPY